MFKRECDRCSAVRACRHTFGRFWEGKSSGGRGCDSPLADEHARQVESTIYAKANRTIEQTLMDY